MKRRTSKEAEKVIAVAPEEIQTHLQRGKAHFEAGRYTEALKEFEAILKTAPGNIEARIWIRKVGEFEVLEVKKKKIKFQLTVYEGNSFLLVRGNKSEFTHRESLTGDLIIDLVEGTMEVRPKATTRFQLHSI